jgi:hypothetical protein
VFTRFHFLRERATLLSALRGDGWDLHSGPGGAVEGTHPEAQDEDEIRSRLDVLGMLTSRALLISFDHSRRASGG